MLKNYIWPFTESIQRFHDHEGRLQGPLQPLVVSVEPER